MPRIKTSNCVSCLFWFGSDAIGIRIIRRGGYFFERSKSSSVAVIPIAIGITAIGTGWGGENYGFKRSTIF